jgi:hypothetical protein
LSVNGTIAGINNGEEPEVVDLVIIEFKPRFELLLIWVVIANFNFHNIETCSVGTIFQLYSGCLVYYIEPVFIDVDELL